MSRSAESRRQPGRCHGPAVDAYVAGGDVAGGDAAPRPKHRPRRRRAARARRTRRRARRTRRRASRRRLREARPPRRQEGAASSSTTTSPTIKTTRVTDTASKTLSSASKTWATAQPVVTTLISKDVPSMGEAVTDEKGWILYRYEKDMPGSGVSNCVGECARAWPPALTRGTPQLEGVSADLVGTVKREDGSKQITIGGWPVYYFAKDAKPGDWKGQGVKSVWFVITKDGKRNLSCLPEGTVVPAGAKEMAKEKEKGGPRIVKELISKEVPAMGNVVTDEKGWILYRYEKDMPASGVSNCVGECAQPGRPPSPRTTSRSRVSAPRGRHGEAGGRVEADHDRRVARVPTSPRTPSPATGRARASRASGSSSRRTASGTSAACPRARSSEAVTRSRPMAGARITTGTTEGVLRGKY